MEKGRPPCVGEETEPPSPLSRVMSVSVGLRTCRTNRNGGGAPRVCRGRDDGGRGPRLRACRIDIGMEEGRPTYVEKETRAGEATTSTTTGGECEGGLRACRRDIGMEEGRPSNVRKETRAGEAHTTVRVVNEGGAPCVS